MNKRPKRTRTRRAHLNAGESERKPGINTMMHPDSAGIDVGAEEFVVAVPLGRGGEASVRTFSTFTSGVEAVRDWLRESGIKTAAMESTGNYWITLYDTLVQAGIEVFLVNARHVKGVPGKKTDVCDAQWLQQLHAAGLLKKSFRPDQDIVPLRFLMRHRGELVGDASKQLQLMQKSLTEMNLKIHHVFSDIDGVSAQAIIDAILQGERDPATLAALRDKRCRTPLSEIKEALRGDYRAEYLFVLRQSQRIWKQLREAIVECDQQIAAVSAKVSCTVSTPLLEAASHKKRTVNKNSPQFAIVEEGWRFYGVDLGTAPGVGPGLLSALMSEVGTREHLLKSFRSGAALASWIGLCPDNRISGGKVLKAKTRKVACRLATALRLAAFGLQRSETKLGEYFRRMKGRLGKAEGLVAAAHKLVRILYGMIQSQRPYDEAEAFKITPQTLARRRRNLEKQAAALGLQLQPIAA